MRMQMGVDIEAPPAAVWPYLVEPDKAMQWYDMLKVFEYTGDGPGPDATFYWEEEVRGTVYWNHFRTTGWEPNRLFAFDMTESSFFVAYSERWTIDPTTTGCRFAFDDDLVFPHGVWGRVMGWFGERMARGSSRQILRNIKHLAEGDVRADRV